MATEHFYTESIWGATAESKEFPALSHDIVVDVAIVGGGITGITAAYCLSRAGKKVAVLEAMQIGKGSTGSSTGNLYASTSEHLFKIGAKHGEETMMQVALSRNEAVNFIEDRIKEFNIDCEFKRVPWYLFTTDKASVRSSEVELELQALQAAGFTASGEAPEEFPFKVAKITNFPQQAQFNPLKYVQQLAKSIQGENCLIYEQTKVLDISDDEPCVVKTSHGTVKATYVIQATHSPKGVYGVHTMMSVYREQALAVKLKGSLPAGGIYWHLDGTQLYSVRPYSNEQGNFLIVLDSEYKVGHKENTEDGYKHLEEYVNAHFDVENIEFLWAAQNYKSADILPYIGNSLLEKHIYIATGFGPDGLTYGTLAAIILNDVILEKENSWSKIYDAKRFTPIASSARVIKETIDVATQFIKDFVFTGKEKPLGELKEGEGKVVELDNKKVAAYKDEQGKLHLVSAICTHMACVVHWNNGEKSWDCPCHGSRFSINGEVLEGPAFYNLAKSGDEKLKV